MMKFVILNTALAVPLAFVGLAIAQANGISFEGVGYVAGFIAGCITTPITWIVSDKLDW